MLWIVIAIIFIFIIILILGLAKASGRYDRDVENQFIKDQQKIHKRAMPDEI